MEALLVLCALYVAETCSLSLIIFFPDSQILFSLRS